MSRPPEHAIRAHLEKHGDLRDVPIKHLLVSWQLDELTPESRESIGAALDRVGVRVEPSLDAVRKHGTISLILARQPPAEAVPEEAPAAAPESARQEQELPAFLAQLDRPRALLAIGGLVALVATWLPWVRWEGAQIITSPPERSANAWGAYGAEPWALLFAFLFGLAVLVPADSVPERWRELYPELSAMAALAFGGLGIIVSLVGVLSPPDTNLYASTEVGEGPFLALAGSLALAAGAWLARPEPDDSLVPSTDG